MIEKIFAENYKAFNKIDIKLSKINLFFGPNNSGKSSILSLLHLLSQTMNSPDPRVSFLLKGSEDFGTYRDLVHNHDIKKEIVMGIKVKNTGVIPFEGEKNRESEIQLTYNYRQKRHQIVLNKIKISLSENLEFDISRPKSYTSDNLYVNTIKQDNKVKKVNIRVDYLDHFIPRFFSQEKIGDSNYEAFWRSWLLLSTTLRKIEIIGPFRVAPLRTYTFCGDYPQSIGIQGERAVDLMVMDHFRQKGKRKQNIVRQLSDWYKKSAISEKIRIDTISDRHYQILFSNVNSEIENNIADVGYGCSQVLPILVSGYSLLDDSTFIVQEPEIHLHPKAQAELGSFFYALSKRNIQTIIETHSEHLLLRLQAHVASKKFNLSPEDVKIFYVNRENGVHQYKEIELNNDGYFAQEWPKGFFPERYLEAKKIASKNLEIG